MGVHQTISFLAFMSINMIATTGATDMEKRANIMVFSKTSSRFTPPRRVSASGTLRLNSLAHPFAESSSRDSAGGEVMTMLTTLADHTIDIHG